jgi:hypothetical protein
MASVTPNAPAALDITAQQGGDLWVPLTLCNPDGGGNPDLSSPYNLSGYTFTGMIRKTQAITGAVVVALTVVSVDLPHGKIGIKLTNAQTAAITAGDYFCDVKGTIGGFEILFTAGKFTVTGRVTPI